MINFEKFENLSTSRAKDRKKLAETLTSEMHKLIPDENLTSSIEYLNTEVFVKFTVKHSDNEAFINIGFDCPIPNEFLDTWNTYNSTFSKEMEWAGDVNPFHRRKATRQCEDFQDLFLTIKKDIELLISGDGFSL